MRRGASPPSRPSLPSPAWSAASGIELAALPRCSFGELRALWTELAGRGTPLPPKCLLLRELAWRIQEQALGGLDAETARLLAAAVRRMASPPDKSLEDDAHPAPTSRGGGASRSTKARSSRPSRGSPSRRSTRLIGELMPGSRLVRVWRGRVHEVEVIDAQRFRFAGREHTSLSAIARLITGVTWSGPRFFGITCRRTKS